MTTINARRGQHASDTALLEPEDREAASIAPEVLFGPFCLRPAQRLLLEADRPIRIGSRGLDLLIALVERAGELVAKDDLIARVWPDTTVENDNLRTQIALLRRALGDSRGGARYVVSVPGRGYQFVAPLIRSNAQQPPAPPAASREPPRDLPRRPARPIGRADIVRDLVGRLRRQRFVTIVGPGGIGKTTVALAVAEALATSCQSAVCFVDLGLLSHSRFVMSTLASALGVATSADDPTKGVIASLRDRQILIVLDCCDRVIDGATVLAETMLRNCPGVRVLATSREVLRADGEAICRLSPLETPPDVDGLTAVGALTFPAVQLFVERAASNIDGFELSDADAPVVADMCRRLDGLPLAIELAAEHVHAFGTRGVAALLGDQFRLLMRGRRTVLRRHQTLGATLDWSYETLSDSERAVLRRLSVFAGGFTLEAARAVAPDAATPAPEITEIVASLVTKSLLQADVSTASGRYRLLDTTRAYGQEKLAQSGELQSVARRHAEYIRRHFASPMAGVALPSMADWLTTSSPYMGDVRMAPPRTFSSGDDVGARPDHACWPTAEERGDPRRLALQRAPPA